jgi:D-alanyl-D-alanine carboxypeptidase
MTAIREEEAPGRLQGFLDRLVTRRRIPHVVMGVTRGDESFHWVGAAGPARADGTAMRPDAPFFIASVTKLYIATTILQLYEGGEVDLDAPMSSYLPEGSVTGLHRLKGVDRTSEITVRHLLSHTSGLPDYLEGRRKGRPSMYREIARGNDQSWDFGDLVDIVRDMRPHFPPQDLGADRQRARYSDTNYQILIAIIEAVTERSFAHVLEQRLLGPLGLRHTYLPGQSQPPEPLPEPAALWNKDQVLDIPRALACFNDLVSTADDTLRFLGALIRGDLFEDPATYRLMQERWNRIFYPMRYGLGMMRFPIARLFGPGRQAVTLIGHSGATGSWLFHCPELDVLLTGTVDEINARALPFRFLPKVLRAVHAFTKT